MTADLFRLLEVGGLRLDNGIAIARICQCPGGARCTTGRSLIRRGALAFGRRR